MCQQQTMIQANVVDHSNQQILSKEHENGNVTAKHPTNTTNTTHPPVSKSTIVDKEILDSHNSTTPEPNSSSYSIMSNMNMIIGFVVLKIFISH